jgi:hypothetical protein
MQIDILCDEAVQSTTVVQPAGELTACISRRAIKRVDGMQNGEFQYSAPGQPQTYTNCRHLYILK